MNVQSYLNSATPVGVKGDGTALLYNCPSCRGKSKLEVESSGLFYCHKCGSGGRLPRNYRRRGRSLLRGPDYAGPVAAAKTVSTCQYTFDPISSTSTQYEYLANGRELTASSILSLRPCWGPSEQYVYFPIYNLGTPSPIYFFGRALNDDTKPRYYNCPRRWFPESHPGMLWGLHRRRTREDHVVICEGIFDAAWGDDRVATLGKQVGRRQVQTLASLRPGRFTIMFDGEATTASTKLAMDLARACPSEIYIAELPFDKDPDQLKEEGETYIRDAVRFA